MELEEIQLMSWRRVVTVLSENILEQIIMEINRLLGGEEH